MHDNQVIHSILNHADLRAVAVGNNNIHALLCKVNDYLGGLCYGFLLFLYIFAKGVSAQSNDNLLLIHKISPILLMPRSQAS